MLSAKRMRWTLVFVAALAVWSPRRSPGQDTSRALPATVFVGSEAENYLRYLQTLGMVEPHPWLLRGFSPSELARLTPTTDAHPWVGQPMLQRKANMFGRVEIEFAPSRLETWYNSAFPFGMNDGAVWVGRGLTSSVETGVAATWGPVSLVAAPTLFWAENQHFALMPNGGTGRLQYGDVLYPRSIDRPQRFGLTAYSRVDPGQSTLRLDALGLAAGISTANEWWGPMSDFPYVLGNNAPGFPRLFFGSSRPWNVWVGRVHGQLLYGRLDQSPYSPVDDSIGRRFASGIVAIFEPRVFPGLEVGATRFFQLPWPDSGLTRDYFTHIFETLLKRNITKVLVPSSSGPHQSADNQIASVFMRWVGRRSGVEAYAEYGREDHNWDARDLMVEPDHSASIGFGLRKAWHREPDRIDVLQAEVINFLPSSFGRHRSDGEGGTYTHAFTRQGHTNRGQLLGAGFAAGGGAATTVKVERFAPRGSSTFSLARLLVIDPKAGDRVDVQYAVRATRSFMWRDKTELRGGLAVVREFERYLAIDAMNWSFDLGLVRYGP
jgi:hypothetical protein